MRYCLISGECILIFVSSCIFNQAYRKVIVPPVWLFQWLCQSKTFIQISNLMHHFPKFFYIVLMYFFYTLRLEKLCHLKAATPRESEQWRLRMILRTLRHSMLFVNQEQWHDYGVFVLRRQRKLKPMICQNPKNKHCFVLCMIYVIGLTKYNYMKTNSFVFRDSHIVLFSICQNVLILTIGEQVIR